MNGEDKVVMLLIPTALSMLFAAVAGYVTHLWWIITILMAGSAVPMGQVILALVGAFVPPLGALHGFWLWFH